MILVGDVGGTKTRLALYHSEDGKMIRQQTETFASQDYNSLVALVHVFLKKHNISATKACFGVPGPVINGKAQATKLPWYFDKEQISKSLSIPKVKLVNDLVATAAAVPYITPDILFTLYEGKQQNFTKRNFHHNQAKKPEIKDSIFGVLAPGTGLGQAFLCVKSSQYHLMASEGGHADFAPTTKIEAELFLYLKSKYDHVSYDRILSGPGLVNIYSFLKDTGFAPEPPELNKRLREEDPGRVITGTGKTGEYELCVKTLDIFASILGAQAGNMALTLMATDGIYLGGGIPASIYKKLAEGNTVTSFLNKGRLSNLVEKTPLYVILDDHAALLGAAHLATIED